MAQANEYYALMQALQQPGNQSTENRQKQFDTMGQMLQQVGQLVLKEKAQEHINKIIKEAEASGKQVSYQVDPNTGMLTPTVVSKPTIFDLIKENPEAFKEGGLMSGYHIEAGAQGKGKLVKNSLFKPSLISGAKSLIQGDKDKVTVKNPITGNDEDIDISDEANLQKLYEYHGGQGSWREDKELISAGLPDMYDKRLQAKKEKAAEQVKIESNKPEMIKKIGSLVEKLWKSNPKEQKQISSDLLKNSNAIQHPIVKRALEIQNKNPKINPVGAFNQAKKELNIGNYKSGETRIIDGVTYIRDESGTWNSEK
jgi:hypothetical protein